MSGQRKDRGMDNKHSIADKLCVSVTYRNRNMEAVCEKTYGLKEYTSLLCLDIKRLILDVEDLVYRLQDGRQKDDWDDAAFDGFNRIRHKLLDKAGDIERMPETIALQGEEVVVESPKEAEDQEQNWLPNILQKVFGQDISGFNHEAGQTK